MRIAIGIVLGALWGALGATLNYRMMKKAVAQNTGKAMSKMGAVRMAVDVGCLGCVFFFRNSEAISFTAALVAAAAALSMLTIYYTFKIAGPDPTETKTEKTE